MDFNHSHRPPNLQQRTLAEHFEQQSELQHQQLLPEGYTAPPLQYGARHNHFGCPPHITPFAPPPGYCDPAYNTACHDTAKRLGSHQRGKAGRAAQVCNNCRDRRKKCDEKRPTCGECETKQITCHYQPVPLSRLDRTYRDLHIQIKSATEENKEMIKEELGRQTERIIQALEQFGLEAPSNDDPTLEYLTAANPSATTGPLLRAGQTSHDYASYVGQDESTLLHNRAATKANSSFSTVDETLKPLKLKIQSNDEDKDIQLGSDASMKLQAGQVSSPGVCTDAAHEIRSLPGNDSFFRGRPLGYIMKGESTHHMVFSPYQRNLDSKNKPQISGSNPRQRPNDDASTSVSSTASIFDGGGSLGTSPLLGRDAQDQSLSIDKATADRLRKSFFHNIHVLQPCMDKVEVTKILDGFIHEYCHEPVVDEHSAYDKVSAKKRRHNETLPKGPQERKQWLERTVENALALLILALGRISEHKVRLPAPVGQESKEVETSSVLSTSTTRQPSNICSVNSKSPRLAKDQYTQGCRDYGLNIDRLPGAAYYLDAVSILGEVVGGNSLIHVQAFLLAGLYLAQYTFIYDSWKWIQIACTAWLMLFKNKDDRIEALSLHENLTYWTCLILESDILTQLRMVPSGVSTFEDLILPPPMVNSIGQQLEEEDLEVREHFLAQINICRILNRAYAVLYQSKSNLERVKLQWAKLDSDDLAYCLEDWRRCLPDRMRWSNSDAPARSIMAARLRAKYYEARNIIFRPFLHRLIASDFSEDTGRMYSGKQQRLDHATKTLENALQCIEAVKKGINVFENVNGMPQRLVVTNIWGTAHIQWSNCLVLGAACQSKEIGRNFTPQDLRPCLDHTIEFLSNLAQLSPTISTNVQILHRVKRHFQQTHP